MEGAAERCLAAASWLSGKPWRRLAAVWRALPVGWRLLQGGLALLLLTPALTRRLHIAPGPTGKAHEAAAMHLHPQAALTVGAVGQDSLEDGVVLDDRRPDRCCLTWRPFAS